MRCVAAVVISGCLSVEVGPEGPVPRPVPDPGPGCERVAVETSDGLSLEADRCPAGDGAPVVVLVHGIGPHNDRTRWSHRTRGALVERGIEVWVPDLRGSGESPGDARAAWAGDAGATDVEAVLRAAAAKRPEGTMPPWVGVGSGHGARAITGTITPAPVGIVVISPGPWMLPTAVPGAFFCGADEEPCAPAVAGQGSGAATVLSARGHGSNLIDVPGGLSSDALADVVIGRFRAAGATAGAEQQSVGATVEPAGTAVTP